jgi:hypothetical protein
MDAHHMLSINGTLIIVIIKNIDHISHRKTTWYQSGTGLDSLTGGPMKMRVD